MLTRLEVDGFKTFRDFAIDFPPFMIAIGRNASGKSNLFDAIDFLSRLASGTLIEAVSSMRGDLDELLHVPLDGPQASVISIAAEVLLDPDAEDDFGEVREITHSRIRYELELEVREIESSRRGAVTAESRRRRLFVKRETARLIRLSDDNWVKSFGLSAKARSNLCRYSNKSKDTLLDTVPNDRGSLAFKVHQDGRSGTTKSFPAADASATVLSTLTTMEYLHLYALKREMQSWRQLHLEPEAIRMASSFDDPDEMSSNGGNLANVLNRIADKTASDDRANGILPEISASLSAIIPEVSGVDVVDDLLQRQRLVMIQSKGEAAFSALVASDGTVRTLALLAALYDPDEGSLICFEEPENGIYPQRLVDLVRQLRELVWDSFENRTRDRDQVVKQLVLSSHSPIILKALSAANRKLPGDEAVYVDMTSRRDGNQYSRVTRARRVVSQSQGELTLDVTREVSRHEVATFEIWSRLSD